eukprot:321035_1
MLKTYSAPRTMSDDEEPYTVVVHYREKQFPYSFTADIDSWDNETYLSLKRRVQQEYRLTGEFGLYEDIDGLEEVDIDDQDDLQDAFQDGFSDDEDDDIPRRHLVHLYVKDHEQLARLSWTIQSNLLIFSRSKQKWYEGKIEKINGQLQEEWLVVRYDSNRKTKEIQRNSTDVKPLPSNHPLALQKGSLCSVYSDKTYNWYKGEIINVFNDAEGEWLKVKYKEEDSVQTAELQRFSSDLKAVSFLKKVINGIGLGQQQSQSFDQIEIVIDGDENKAESRGDETTTKPKPQTKFITPMAVDQISIPYIVSGYVRRVEQNVSMLGGALPNVIFEVCLAYSRPCTMWMECAEGDRILLKDGKSGIVRYIGRAPLVNEELVGIELDEKSSNSNDMNLFTAPPGRSYFIGQRRPGHLENNIGEGNYAKIIGLNKVPSFNGKIVKLATFVEKKGRWKVKLASGVAQKKYLGVKATNLKSIPVWHELAFQISSNLQQSLRKNPQINDMVLTVNNKYGKVMHCKGNEIGIKLSKYDVNAGDGSLNQTSYLNVNKGYGYFVDIKYLAAINPNENVQCAVQPGEYVVLNDGEDTTGIVTFNTNNIIGVEREKGKETTEYIVSSAMIRDVVAVTNRSNDDLDEITQRLNDARIDVDDEVYD